MKTIGLIGGMSWESTASYYQAINQGVKQQLGGLHSAKIILNSGDFAEIEQLQHQGNWERTAEILSDAAQSLERAGADFFVICTNTMHKVAEQVAKEVNIPLVHIADATAEVIKQQKFTKVGLLGTQFTMAQGFYKNRLIDHHDIDVIVPKESDQEFIHRVIYQELCLGKINPSSREQYLAIIEKLHQQGAQAVILGCTEIALLVKQQHTQVPLLYTTKIHAEQAVKLALART